MSALQNNQFLLASGSPTDPTFPLQRSVRLRSSASAYFNRTFGTPTDSTKFTWSAWVKRGALNAVRQGLIGRYIDGNNSFRLFFDTNDTLVLNDTQAASTKCNVVTNAVFRDPSAWYHILVAIDTANGTAANRQIIYVNGVQQTFSSATNYSATSLFNVASAANTLGLTTDVGPTNKPFDGYLTEVNFIDGQALTPTSFGGYNSGTGVWEPRKYTGTYGTNGFYLNFQDNSAATATTIGKDSSGNGNNWTPNNISVTAGVTYDSMLDVPTLTSNTNANFPVLNVVAGLGNGTYSDGNLAYLNGVAATWKSGVGSMGATSGKYYFEYTIAAVSNSSNFYLGVAGSTYNGFASYLGRTSDSWAFQWNGTSSVKTNNDVSTTVSTAGSISVNNVIQVAIDLGTGSIWWGRNNTWVQGDPSAGTGASFTNLTGTILAGFAVYSNGGDKIAANFGQRPFTYTPPTGFKSLNTYNLPDPTIKKGNQYFDATLWTGDGTDPRPISNSGSMQPDLVWVKARGASTLSDHVLNDSVRGATKDLFSNLTAAEGANNSVRSFNAGGFSVGNSTRVNQNTIAYVGWQWNAGGNTVTNTAGSITSSVRANPSAGFSIVTYTGTGANATVGHGLGIAPRMIIVKWRTGGTTESWAVYHASLGATNYMSLNTGNASAAGASLWNNTSPTSTVATIGTDTWVNASTRTYVAYCFSEIAGYSKFGSYTGNGSTDGPFVYCGFRPKFVMIKNASTITDWWMMDTSRDTSNVVNNVLVADSSGSESSLGAPWAAIDILSNGFKARITNAGVNGSGNTLVFMAFAESPFNYSLAR